MKQGMRWMAIARHYLLSPSLSPSAPLPPLAFHFVRLRLCDTRVRHEASAIAHCVSKMWVAFAHRSRPFEMAVINIRPSQDVGERLRQIK